MSNNAVNIDELSNLQTEEPENPSNLSRIEATPEEIEYFKYNISHNNICIKRDEKRLKNKIYTYTHIYIPRYRSQDLEESSILRFFIKLDGSRYIISPLTDYHYSTHLCLSPGGVHAFWSAIHQYFSLSINFSDKSLIPRTNLDRFRLTFDAFFQKVYTKTEKIIINREKKINSLILKGFDPNSWTIKNHEDAISEIRQQLELFDVSGEI